MLFTHFSLECHSQPISLTFKEGDQQKNSLQIRAELNKLDATNDKGAAKIVEKRLITIEQQIMELEKKYNK